MRRRICPLLALGAVFVLLPAAAWALSRDAASAVRLSLSVPGQVGQGERVSVSGAATDAPAGSHVVVELATGGRWRQVAAARLRRDRFAASLSLPAGVALARVRAQLLDGRRRLATSPVRRVRVRPDAAVGVAGAATEAEAPAQSAVEPSPQAPSEPAPEEPAPYDGPMYWGAWIEGAPWDWSKVTDFEAEVGKPLSVLQFSAPFLDCTSGSCVEESFPTSPFEAIREHGAIPFFSWGSQSNPASARASEYQLADLIDGSHDAYIEEFAEAAAAWGHPFFLRFDWEMNGNWFLWGEGANGNLPGEFVAAWRHVHDLFVAAGATNATWVWCPFVNPNHSSNIAADLGSLYPGDSYVDWTCLDGYNWGEHPEKHQRWRTFSELFAPTYDEVVNTIAPDKPMLIGETASSEEGGSKAQWIEEMFAALPSRYPAMRGLIWFDVFDQEHDWPLSTSPQAEAAFAAGVSDPRWLGNSFGDLDTSPIPSPG